MSRGRRRVRPSTALWSEVILLTAIRCDNSFVILARDLALVSI